MVEQDGPPDVVRVEPPGPNLEPHDVAVPLPHPHQEPERVALRAPEPPGMGIHRFRPGATDRV